MKQLLPKSVAAFIMPLVGIVGLAGAAKAEITLPLATWAGQKHVAVREFVPSLEKALQDLGPGKFKLQHFPGGQMGQDKDMPVGIPSGQVKFGLITVSGWSGTVRDSKVMDAPTGLTMKQLDELLYEKGLFAALQSKFKEKNTILLGLTDLGPPAVISKKRIVSPKDFKGLKVRVYSEGQAEAVLAMGGAPVTVAFAELYGAIQYGTVDAAIVGFQGVDSQKMHEVTSHVLVPASFLGTAMVGWAANARWMRGMPEADRNIFLTAMARAAKENRQAVVKEIDELTQAYRSRGMTVTFLDASMPEHKEWVTATTPALAKARNELSPELAKILFGN